MIIMYECRMMGTVKNGKTNLKQTKIRIAVLPR